MDLRDNDESQYFSIAEYNNGFIIIIRPLTTQGRDLPFFTQERGYNDAWAEYMRQTHLDCTTHEYTIICYLQVTW